MCFCLQGQLHNNFLSLIGNMCHSTFVKIFILHLLISKQPSEILGFKHLNEIGVKNEHFNFAILNVK